MGIWARTYRVDRGMDGFREPSGAHFVVCSLLVFGPKYQILLIRGRRSEISKYPRKYLINFSYRWYLNIPPWRPRVASARGKVREFYEMYPIFH
jgi:hypothetical protein